MPSTLRMWSRDVIENADPKTDAQPRHTHTCEACGAAAAFGFHTRRGEVWYCRDHRDQGNAIVEPPPRMRRIQSQS